MRPAATRAELQALAALPEDRVQGMPGVFYTDPARFALECDTVLRRGWHCLGRCDELTEPLIAIRGDDGEIRVLSSVCRHRGMPLAEGRGRARRLICTYHAWAYGLDGALLRAARMQNAGFDPAGCRLPAFETRQWNGFLYVTLADEPLAFDAAALDGLLAPYEPVSFRLVHVAEEDWHCNWKCLVENFMEGYHLSVVRPQTLHGYTPTGMARKGPSGAGFTSYQANFPDSAEARGQGAPGLSDAERRRSTLFARFPTHMASQAATLLVSLSVFPRSVERITVKWTLPSYGDELRRGGSDRTGGAVAGGQPRGPREAGADADGDGIASRRVRAAGRGRLRGHGARFPGLAGRSPGRRGAGMNRRSDGFAMSGPGVGGRR